MKPLPVIAIFDVGKTNKKILLFDKHYNVVFEKSTCLNEITDEDGDPCEDIDALRLLFFDYLNEVLGKKEYALKAINYSAYGASFVYLDKKGNVLTPLYNYLKKYSKDLHKKFYRTYGSEKEFAHRTASPVLGNLNSGLQLYRMKYEKPEVFKNISRALHLPQYLSYLLTGKLVSDITSIGCHTGLWDFLKNNYHEWVEKEGIKNKLAPLLSSSSTVKTSYKKHNYISGIGLHDSSAALIPYLLNFKDPFVLISTGTWNITLSPFNQTPLTDSELRNDCLCYMSYKGISVKASRLFAGYEHDEHVKLISSYFKKSLQFYKQVSYDPSIINKSKNKNASLQDLSSFKTFEEAYHHLIFHLVKKQVASSEYVMTKNVKKVLVDGGFSQNSVFMNLLASFYPGKKVYAAMVAQSTALGAALAIHDKWNNNLVPSDLINLKYYAPGSLHML